MTYEEFLKFVQAKCTYETIYSDSDGRNILVIKLLDAYGMVNKAQRQWVGLTDEEKQTAIWTDGTFGAGALWADAKLKENNT